MNEIQNSTKFIMDSVVQTLQIVSDQQEQLNRVLLLKSNNMGKGNAFFIIKFNIFFTTKN